MYDGFFLQPQDSRATSTTPSTPRRRRPCSISLLEVDVLDRNAVGFDRDVQLLGLQVLVRDFDLVLTGGERKPEVACLVRLDLQTTRLDGDRRTLHRLATLREVTNDTTELTGRQLGLEHDRRDGVSGLRDL